MDLNPIILSIPVYFLLIGLEVLVQYFTNEKLYRLSDAVTNMSCGITQQISGVFLKVSLLAGYALLYEHFRLFSIPMNTWTWLFLFVLADFCYYWAHRMSHEVNLFWGGHVVHHQSEDYNFSVALRQGSFQAIWTSMFYWPLAILGFDTLSFVFASALVTIYQFWIHTEKIGKLGLLEWVLNTPSHHRVHHGRNPKYIDKNHAGVFIIWDRLFGTFQKEEEKPTYGITTPVNSWNPVWVNIQHYAGMWQQLKQTPLWIDKVKTLLYKPGWRPEQLGGYLAPPEPDKAGYEKFQVPLPSWLAGYVLFQYALCLSGTAWFLFSVEHLLLWQKVVGAIFITYSVLSIGWLLERRSFAFRLESGRLFFLGASLVLFAFIVLQQQLIALISAVFVLSMYVWLWKTKRVSNRLASLLQKPAKA